MTTSHAVSRDDVMAYVDGELSADHRARVQSHLIGCDACRALAEELRAVSARLQAWQVDRGPAAMPRALQDALAAPPRGSGSRWAFGAGAMTWPRWGFAAASLAAVVLVGVIARPGGPIWRSASAPESQFGTMADARSAQAPAPTPPPAAEPSSTPPPAAPARSSVENLTPVEPARQTPVAGGVDGAKTTGSLQSLTPPPPSPPAPPPPPPAAPAEPLPKPSAPVVVAGASPIVGSAAASVEQRFLARAGERGAASGLADTTLTLAESTAPRRVDDRAPASEVRLTLVAGDPLVARASLEALARDLDGRLESAAASGGDVADRSTRGGSAGRAGGGGGLSFGGRVPEVLTLRVPVEQVETAMVRLRTLGEVRDESRQDVAVQAELAEATRQIADVERTEQDLASRRATADPSDVAGLDRAIRLTRDRLATLRADQATLHERQRFVTITITVR